MNIFFLDQKPHLAAQMLCNAHVRSQIKESCDMLSTAHYLQGDHTTNMYPPTHKHHPCTKWVMASHKNYMWLYEHLKAMLTEYEFRHRLPNHRAHMLKILEPVPQGLEYHYNERITTPPAVVPEDLKPKNIRGTSPTLSEVVEAYRAYYNRDKRHLHHWMVRPKPNWIKPWEDISLTILTQPLKQQTIAGPNEDLISNLIVNP